MAECSSSFPHPQGQIIRGGEDPSDRGTHSLASDSCSLVRFRGWLSVVMLWARWAGPGGRRACRSALLARLTKATMACQPLLLNQIWGGGQGPGVKLRGQGKGVRPVPSSTCLLPPTSHLEAVLSVQAVGPRCEVVQEAVEGPTRLRAQQCP